MHCLGLVLKPSFGGLGRLSSSRPQPPSPSPKEKERYFISYPNYITSTLNICSLFNVNLSVFALPGTCPKAFLWRVGRSSSPRPQPPSISPKKKERYFISYPNCITSTLNICSLFNVNRQSNGSYNPLYLPPTLGDVGTNTHPSQTCPQPPFAPGNV